MIDLGRQRGQEGDNYFMPGGDLFIKNINKPKPFLHSHRMIVWRA
jgi:hypothetical protein